MPSGQIFNAMVAFFEEDDWKFQWMDGLPVLSMGFTGRSGKWVCYAQAREDQEQCVFYSVCPLNVPTNRRAAVAEFITRANYGMIIGNFEMDFTDGEVRYKTSIDVEGTSLTSALLKQLVYANVIVMDRYLPGLVKVMYSDSTPQEVIAQIEEGSAFTFTDRPSDEDREAMLLDHLYRDDMTEEITPFDRGADDDDDADDDGDDDEFDDFDLLPPDTASLN